jgi:ABC-type transporter MlaC component
MHASLSWRVRQHAATEINVQTEGINMQNHNKNSFKNIFTREGRRYDTITAVFCGTVKYEYQSSH